MKTYNFSLKTFTSTENCSFSPEEYSRFKYGSKKIAKQYGKELGESLFNLFDFSQLQSKKIVICSSPYKYIPTASAILKDYAYSEFNKNWSEHNETCQDLKVFRAHSYNSDYGAMAQDEREKVINADTFHIDSSFIKGKTLILIDDIKITGAHERRMISLLKRAKFSGEAIFVYYAELVNKEANASIENELNYAYAKTLLNIDNIIKNDGFVFNTRVTKFILKAEFSEFKNFIDYQTQEFREQLVTYTMGNDYHKLEEFKTNFNYLKTKI